MTPEERRANHFMRAIGGAFVPELDPALRAIAERTRERLRHELGREAIEAYKTGGAPAFEACWREKVDEILDQSLAAVVAALEVDRAQG